MLQSSITAWLKKPSSVTQAEASGPLLVNSTPKRLSITEQSSTTTSIEPDNNLFESNHPLDIATQDVSLTKCVASRPLPDNVDLVPLTEDFMPAFKRLNALLLPIPYPPAFYVETMTEPYHGLTLIALWHSDPLRSDLPHTSSEKPRLIGAIRCRILPSATLYISTLGLLSPYRSHGIATHLLQRIVVKASKEHGIRCITAHVWEVNDLGLDWYTKRGFEIIGREEGYYRRLKPAGAILVRRWIGVGDLLGSDACPNSLQR